MIKINGVEIKQNHFPDGTLLVKYAPDNGLNTIYWQYESDSELFTLYCLKKHIDEVCLDSKVDLLMPYIPHARQDRTKVTEDIFTLKYFSEIINSLNFENVMAMDAHSNVSLALLDRVVQMPIDQYIQKALTNIVYQETGGCMQEDRSEAYKNLITFFPDEGAMKRYSYRLGFPYAFGIKDRDWDSGDIKGLKLMNNEIIAGKNVLIIDDICSKGGTFYHSAKALKETGAKNIYLYITHCENTILEGELLTSGLIKRVYTTNSIFTKEHEKIEVFEL